MIKRYQPKTVYYNELRRSWRAELLLLGYAAGTASMSGAGEFLQRMEERGKLTLDQVEREDIEQHLEYLQTRPSRRGGALSLYTVKGYVFSISLLFDYAERHGLRGGSPLAGLSLPALPISSRYVASREEIAKLYAAASGDDRARAVLHLLYACGLRRNEAERLNVGDVDYGTALLYVRSGKGKKRRVIPLTETVATGLKEYQKQDRWRWVGERSGKAFLLNDRGGRMLGATIARQLKDLVGEAKVSSKITPHVLRHAVATHLVGGGMDLERVRDFLGHEHLETTQIYAHIKADDV